MSDTSINLDELRQRIDQLDSDILNLISERASCAQQVAHVKLAEDKDAVFYRPEREAQVLRRIMALNKGPLDSEEMARLFREIMSACLATICWSVKRPAGIKSRVFIPIRSRLPSVVNG